MLTFQGVKTGIARISGVAFFVIPFGFAFGTAAVEKGLTQTEAIVASITVFAGASQFAVLELWSDPPPLLAIAFVALAVNARHLIFGAALAPMLNGLPWRQRLLSMFFLSDTNFADMQAARQAGSRDLGILVGGGLLVWLAWVSGTAFGAVFGGSAKDLPRYGIDVVMAAFFVTTILGSARTAMPFLPIILAAIVSVATLSLLPHGGNVIAGALAGGIAGAIGGR